VTGDENAAANRRIRINRDETVAVLTPVGNLPLILLSQDATCLAKMPTLAPAPLGAAWEGFTLRASKAIVAAAAAVGSILLAAGCGSSSPTSSAAAAGTASSGTASSTDWATATSAASGGGMSALVAAAKKEGHLNVITLPADWANYGNIIKDFEAKYGIKINSENPEGSSQDELNAVKQLKGQSTAPDVVDVGGPFAETGKTSGDWAPYEVATWSDIPAAAKDPGGSYYADYGGYVAIGYDTTKVKVAPTSFKSLLNPAYKNMIAINGNPAQTGASFAAVYAAALANGGSLSNIAPGVTFFKSLKQAGNFVPVKGTPATVQSGQTPILIWWDYLLASEVTPVDKNFKIVIPTDAQYAGYYYQAVSKYAANPAAARLWEEYLYSAEGQNLWLEGAARPIEMNALISAGTINKTAEAALPAVPGSGTLQLASTAQNTAAESIVAQQWPSVSG
jgi:putative spermidine/putrescine transport system substrate-binding protein